MNPYSLLLNYIHVQSAFIIDTSTSNEPYEAKETKKSYIANLILHHLDIVEIIARKTNYETLNPNKFYINLIVDYRKQIDEYHKRKTLDLKLMPNEIEEDVLYALSPRGSNQSYYYLPKYNMLLLGTINREIIDQNLFNNIDLQMAHLISITKNSPLKVTQQTITTPVDIEPIKKQLLKNTINHFERVLYSTNYERKLENLIDSRRDVEYNIKDLEDQLVKIAESIRTLEDAELYKKIPGLLEDLFPMVDRNVLIKDISVSKTGNGECALEIITNEIPWNKFDRAQLESMLPNIWREQKGFKHHLREMLSGNEVLYFGQYLIEIVITLSGSIKSKLIPMSKFKNPHQEINCYGGYGSYITNYTRNKDITNLILTYIEFLRHITLGDGGSSKLPFLCYFKNQKGDVVYDGTTRDPYEATQNRPIHEEVADLFQD